MMVPKSADVEGRCACRAFFAGRAAGASRVLARLRGLLASRSPRPDSMRASESGWLGCEGLGTATVGWGFRAYVNV